MTCYTTCVFVCQSPVTSQHSHTLRTPIHFTVLLPHPTPPNPTSPRVTQTFPLTCSVRGRAARMLDPFLLTKLLDSILAGRGQKCGITFTQVGKKGRGSCVHFCPGRSLHVPQRRSNEIKPRQEKLTGKTLSQLLGRGGASVARRPITGKDSLPPACLIGSAEEVVYWRWEEMSEGKTTLTPPVILSSCYSLHILFRGEF